MSRKHNMLKVRVLLNTLQKEPKNLMRLHKELKEHEGFRDYHSVQRHLRICIDLGFVEVAKINKKWGLPTKIFQLTDKGKEFLRICEPKEILDSKEVLT